MNNRFFTKTKLKIGLALVLLVLLQSTMFDYIKIFNTKPDMVLVAIIIIGLSLDLKWVMIFSYAAGFLKDMLGVLPLGLNTLVLPLLGYLLFRLSKKMIIESNYVRGAIIFIAVILEHLVVSLLLITLGLNISLGMLSRFTILGSIYTTLLFLLLTKIIKIPGLTSQS